MDTMIFNLRGIRGPVAQALVIVPDDSGQIVVYGNTLKETMAQATRTGATVFTVAGPEDKDLLQGFLDTGDMQGFLDWLDQHTPPVIPTPPPRAKEQQGGEHRQHAHAVAEETPTRGAPKKTSK